MSRWNNPLIRSPLILTSVPGHPSIPTPKQQGKVSNWCKSKFLTEFPPRTFRKVPKRKAMWSADTESSAFRIYEPLGVVECCEKLGGFPYRWLLLLGFFNRDTPWKINMLNPKVEVDRRSFSISIGRFVWFQPLIFRGVYYVDPKGMLGSSHWSLSRWSWTP